MPVLLASREPQYASAVQRKGQCLIYFDKDGFPACTNVAIRAGGRICDICGNMAISFMQGNPTRTDSLGECICSACGKFPHEALIRTN